MSSECCGLEAIIQKLDPAASENLTIAVIHPGMYLLHLPGENVEMKTKSGKTINLRLVRDSKVKPGFVAVSHAVRNLLRCSVGDVVYLFP